METDWHPAPRDLDIVYVSVLDGGPRYLYGVHVGWGGPSGRTPMVRGKDGQWQEHTVPLQFVWLYDVRMRLLKMLEEAEG
jgi:hypothetical protein